MKKNKKSSVSDMMNRARGMNRERYARPRSVVFVDKTKYNRKKNGKVIIDE